MDTLQAYELAIKKVQELRDEGIEVTYRASRSRNNAETIKKYSGPERVPPDKWYHISFKITNKIQALKIHEAANYLGMAGMRFDTGGSCDCRDWELDWSFKYTGTEDEQWREAREDVEDEISGEMDEPSF